MLLHIADRDKIEAEDVLADNLDPEITVNQVAEDAVEETVAEDIITAVITIVDIIIAAPVQPIGGQIRSKHAHAQNLN